MKGKTVLITGATSGIGYQSALSLEAKGARVIITGRNEIRGQQAVDELCKKTNQDQIEFMAVDHSIIGDNRKLAESILTKLDRLDILINNSGGIFSERLETKDGLEATLALNFLGPYVLTRRLQPLLIQNSSSRIININSSAHEMCKADPFEDIGWIKPYVGIEAYARAKLLNLLWTFALARKLNGLGVTINATNPGMAWTAGTQAMTAQAVPTWRFIWPIIRFIQRWASAETASKSTVFLASSTEITHASGGYFESNALPKIASGAALNKNYQNKVWGVAEELVEQAMQRI
jgi:NAD(P)-dependent dehydrogenase (short-subunit alcohol dehydrogenase family)